jgi:hypothetical protein
MPTPKAQPEPQKPERVTHEVRVGGSITIQPELPETENVEDARRTAGED